MKLLATALLLISGTIFGMNFSELHELEGLPAQAALQQCYNSGYRAPELVSMIEYGEFVNAGGAQQPSNVQTDNAS